MPFLEELSINDVFKKKAFQTYSAIQNIKYGNIHEEHRMLWNPKPNIIQT
jgi:hypothetical protein